jgi:hypothetical protein
MKTLRPHAPALLAAALVTLVSWPVTGNLQPRLDLDGAWEIALRQALHDGLHFGPDLVFTYGPLGFLREPMLVYASTARLAFVYGLLVHFTLCATLIWGLRRALGSLLVASLVAVPLAAAMWQEPTLVIGFAAAVALAAGLARSRPAALIALGLGVLSGIELLSKLSTGVTLAGLGVVAVLAAPSPRPRPAAAFAAGLLGALAVGWLATGQSLGAIGDYLDGSFQIVSGYSAAMYFEDPAAAWELSAAFLLIAIGYAVAWRAGDLLTTRSRLGLLALWTVLAFTTFKAGFVRHDPVHSNILFASLLGGFVAFGWVPHRRASAWLVGALASTMLLASLGVTPASYVAPVARASDLVDQARLLADGRKTREAIDAARAARLPLDRIDPKLVAAARAGTVHVDPVEAGLVWVQHLRWRPLPVFQSYSAYTSRLDERNAAAVRSPSGPDRILREDGVYLDRGNPIRRPEIDEPATMRAMLCHFREQETIAPWMLIERTANRCGAPRPLATSTARLGVPAPIPPAPDADSVVFVRIDGIDVSGLERLRTLVYRALPRAIEFDGGRSRRLLPGTAGDGLVLRVPKRADFPAPFALDQATNTLTITRALDRGEVRLRFFAMPIR